MNAQDYIRTILASQIAMPDAPAAPFRNLPIGLGAIPELSLLTEFECVMATPQPDAVEAIQINPSHTVLSYGPIRR